ncbi:uncharacterized protein BJ171DRAFT_491657 [Polychytrium aggregatum]|uniref:uncharacterized protein n=1 Tax=Polychytrium aggregatum TaxID=110093 RepID=UPI0022FE4828|nr:uncharacterized protein BJ171DRAFT_491657 [Polychytrium aggregatum]KAI9207830.1 hypothetical protein BJ171DRAFT_491657 [Polychytrium aggregatum]
MSHVKFEKALPDLPEPAEGESLPAYRQESPPSSAVSGFRADQDLPGPSSDPSPPLQTPVHEDEPCRPLSVVVAPSPFDPKVEERRMRREIWRNRRRRCGCIIIGVVIAILGIGVGVGLYILNLLDHGVSYHWPTSPDLKPQYEFETPLDLTPTGRYPWYPDQIPVVATNITGVSITILDPLDTSITLTSHNFSDESVRLYYHFHTSLKDLINQTTVSIVTQPQLSFAVQGPLPWPMIQTLFVAVKVEFPRKMTRPLNVTVTGTSGNINIFNLVASQSFCNFQVTAGTAPIIVQRADLSSSSKVSLFSGGGDIVVSTFQGSSVSFVTTSGVIDLTSVTAQSIALQTVTGIIQVEDTLTATNVSLQTQSGNVAGMFAVAGSMRHVSSDGSVNVQMTFPQSGLSPLDLGFSTISGNVSVQARGPFSGAVDCTSSSGQIQIQGPSFVTDPGSTPQHISGNISTGASRMKVSTSSGSVRVLFV